MCISYTFCFSKFSYFWSNKLRLSSKKSVNSQQKIFRCSNFPRLLTCTFSKIVLCLFGNGFVKLNNDKESMCAKKFNWHLVLAFFKYLREPGSVQTCPFKVKSTNKDAEEWRRVSFRFASKSSNRECWRDKPIKLWCKAKNTFSMFVIV